LKDRHRRSRRQEIHRAENRPRQGLQSQQCCEHGFFARDLFPLVKLDTERQEEFRALWERLLEEYQPGGNEEEWEVERIAICRWKLGRAWRYENAEINRGILDVHYKEFQDYGP